MTATTSMRPSVESFRHLMSSFRWRIVGWIIAVVLTVLATVIYLSYAIQQATVHDQANANVEQEVQEFLVFARDNTNPQTSQPYADPHELLLGYLAHQIPNADEAMLGIVGHQLIQHSTTPQYLTPDSPLVKEILSATTNSGIHTSPDGTPVHWGRVIIVPEGPAHEPADTSYFVVASYTDAMYATARQQTQLMALIGVGGLGFAGIIAWIVAAQISAPIRRLQQVAGSIDDKNLTSRVPVEGTDEVAMLSEKFNSMLDRIDQAYRTQRQFVDDAGHELRTPITVIRGNLELMPTYSTAQRDRAIAMCVEELDRMTRMVNDMLTLAVADTGEHFLTTAEVDVADLTLSIEDKAFMLAGDRLVVDSIAERTINADAERITEALLEMVRNALKYSDEGTPIAVRSREEPGTDMVTFAVHNLGEHIPDEAREGLFQRFHRADIHRAHASGAGLGLAIVDAIAKAHGGYAFAANTVTVGGVPGVEFGITLPATGSPVPDAC